MVFIIPIAFLVSKWRLIPLGKRLMVFKKKDQGGDKRDKKDDEEASRAARRAARDKAFGRSGPSDDGDRGESGAGGNLERRELPMVGSARELRRLRKSGPDVPAMLEEIKCDELARDIVQKRRLFYAALGLVSFALVLWVVSLVFHWPQVTYITKFSILAAPICIGLGINELCLNLARTNPALARNILSFLTFGVPQSVRTLASLYVDTGDYAKAEKTIGGVVGTIDPKKKLRDYIMMHAYLANLRAHIGRTQDAEQLIRQVLNAAEDHNKERQTDGSAFLLATSLNYAAQLCDQKDKMQDALALSRRAVKLLCDHRKPPVDVTLFALSNAGYYCTVVGEYQEALAYLTKAHELAQKTGIARDGQMAFILSNLAVANLGIGRSTQCKRLLNEAETRAMLPLGLSERPHTYQCWAIYHFANERLEYALQSYEKSIEYLSIQNPKESVLLLRIMKEYSVLLRELGKMREANENEQRVTRIKDTLVVVASKPPDKKDRKVKPLAVPVSKSRFPIFWTILACFWGFNIWVDGLRFARFTEWLLFLTGCVVIAVKIRAKYGPPIREETSQGAIVAVVSLIPGLRSIVPELSMVPQKTGGIIIGTAAAVMMLVQFTKPQPDTVPEFGLLPQEYLVLGDELSSKESFVNAKKAYELAMKGGESRFAPAKLRMGIPKHEQTPEAIGDNMKAVELNQTNPKEAKKIWEACVRRYPDFEYPYVHLAALASPIDLSHLTSKTQAAAKKEEPDADSDSAEGKAERKKKAVEAEHLLEKALAINPDCGVALMGMYEVQQQLERPKAGRKYLNRYIELSGASLAHGILSTLQKVNEEGDTKSEDENQADSKTSESEAGDESQPARKAEPVTGNELVKEVEGKAKGDSSSKDSSSGKSAVVDDDGWGDEAPAKPAKKHEKNWLEEAAKPSEKPTEKVPPKQPTAPPKEKKAEKSKPKKKVDDDSWKKLSPDDTDW